MTNDAFERGFVAFNYANSVNPYGKESYLHKEWERGYNAAYFANLKKVKERESATA